jgi:hypothetical protein
VVLEQQAHDLDMSVPRCRDERGCGQRVLIPPVDVAGLLGEKPQAAALVTRTCCFPEIHVAKAPQGFAQTVHTVNLKRGCGLAAVEFSPSERETWVEKPSERAPKVETHDHRGDLDENILQTLMLSRIFNVCGCDVYAAIFSASLCASHTNSHFHTGESQEASMADGKKEYKWEVRQGGTIPSDSLLIKSATSS